MSTSFDFPAFLALLRTPPALPLLKHLQNFLDTSTPKQLTSQMETLCENNPIWKENWDNEKDGVREGIEKLVMTKMYARCFSEKQDAIDDRNLSRMIHIYSWIKPEHLDIKFTETTETNPLLLTAQKEILKLDNYKAPRDKVVCVMNCCKTIISYMKQDGGATGADEFFPLMVYTILKAKPTKLYSNLNYIERYRHPSKLQSEAGYYVTTLNGAMDFIMRVNADLLSIPKDEHDNLVAVTTLSIRRQSIRDLAAIPTGIPRNNLLDTHSHSQSSSPSPGGRRPENDDVEGMFDFSLRNTASPLKELDSTPIIRSRSSPFTPLEALKRGASFMDRLLKGELDNEPRPDEIQSGVSSRASPHPNTFARAASHSGVRYPGEASAPPTVTAEEAAAIEEEDIQLAIALSLSMTDQ